jgi:uncharacterized protein (TIGR02265 family)
VSDDHATVDGSLFEGLARAFRPGGAFADDLRAAGYDVRAPRLRYPSAVLLAVLDVIHRHAFPEQTREQAHREAGRRVVASFLDTIFGKVIHVLMRMLGLRRFLLRLPKIASMGTTGLNIQVVEEEVAGAVRLTFRSGVPNSPDFVAGALEGAASVVSESYLVEVTLREPKEYELRVSGLR